MALRFLALFFAGAVLVGILQPRVDRTRHERAVDAALVFVPDGKTLRIASSGLHEPTADLMWVHAGLLFGERWDEPGAGGAAARVREPDWLPWLERTLEAIHTLDPRWRTPYYYGALMLRVLGDIDGSDATLRRATEALPNEWFFPFNLGMNYFLYRDDPAEAARWIERAAALPGAPKWYAAAAASMKEEAGQRDTAIRYLEDVLATATDPLLVSDTTNKLVRLRHNALVAQWEGLCRQLRADRGRPLESPEELERLAGRPLPPNPRGDAWVVGGDGVVRGVAAERERRRRTAQGEWTLAGR